MSDVEQRSTDRIRQDGGFAILGAIAFVLGFLLSRAWGGFAIVALFGLLVALFAVIRIGWHLAFD